LCCDFLQKIARFGKSPSPYYGKNSFIITLRHESQSTWNISRTLKVSSSAVSKTIKGYDETGSHEDRHRNGRPRTLLQKISSLDLPALEIAAQINASQSSIKRHISTSTVQKGLRDSGLQERPVEICPLVWSPNLRF
jgi:transposase